MVTTWEYIECKDFEVHKFMVIGLLFQGEGRNSKEHVYRCLLYILNLEGPSLPYSS